MDTGTLDVTVYRKPTHTDRYILVCCLYDRARKVTTSPDSLRREEKYPKVKYGCPSFVIEVISSWVPERAAGGEATTVVLPYGESFLLFSQLRTS